MRLGEIEIKARNFLQTEVAELYCYHNLGHTIMVVEESKKFVKRYELGEREAELLLIAAWTHDLGFQKGAEFHELRSAEIAGKWMLENDDYNNQDVQLVQSMILATKIPQNPKNQLSAFLCDADLAYLGDEKEYPRISNLLIKEWVDTGVCKDDPKRHLELQIGFLLNHRFQTPYGQESLTPGKSKIIKQLQEKRRALS
ncbi:hypothetical protein N8482_01920 [Chitinophagales bacterium]|nr:hypothetical protein [Chitinophagales bacterium]